jgi:hypothetical protein
VNNLPLLWNITGVPLTLSPLSVQYPANTNTHDHAGWRHNADVPHYITAILYIALQVFSCLDLLVLIHHSIRLQDVATHLAHTYGDRAPLVLDACKKEGLTARLSPRFPYLVRPRSFFTSISLPNIRFWLIYKLIEASSKILMSWHAIATMMYAPPRPPPTTIHLTPFQEGEVWWRVGGYAASDTSTMHYTLPFTLTATYPTPYSMTDEVCAITGGGGVVECWGVRCKCSRHPRPPNTPGVPLSRRGSCCGTQCSFQ